MFIAALSGIQRFALAAESTKNKPAKTQMTLKIGSSTFTATLEENATATAFKMMLPMTVKMTELNGNEKYYRLRKDLPIKPSNPEKIENGDLMMYGADTLVLFYKSFPAPYTYTRIGRIHDHRALAAAVGSGNVSVTYELSSEASKLASGTVLVPSNNLQRPLPRA
jgi:hypothetical protein